MDEATIKTIEKIKARIQGRDQQTLADKRLINQLCEMEGEELMFSEASLASQDASIIATSIRGDQFLGRPMATVVREILERRTQKVGAIPLDELFEIMKAGGYDFDNKNEAIAKRNVAITIGKNSGFVKVPNSGYIGLAEWYPGYRERKAKNGESAKDEQAVETETAVTAENPQLSKTGKLPANTPETFTTEGMPE